MPREAAKLKAVVIGAGNMGRNHVRNYLRIPEVELLAIADINPETRQLAEEFGIKHYTDYKQMLDEIKPQLASVVVPTPLHEPIGREVISRGIHVLVEKPIATSVKEADELIEAARQNGVIFTVGHIEHYNPIVLKLKALIKSGKVGEVTSVVCKRVGGFPKNEPKTDVIIDLAVHDIGIIGFLLDKHPQRVFSHGSQTLHSHKIDAAEILLDYGTASGFIQANWTTPVKIRNISVTGTDGYAEGNYITQELILYEHNAGRKVKDFAGFVSALGSPHHKVVPLNFEEPLIAELKTLVRAVKTGDTSGLVKPEAAREALKIALEAIEPGKEYQNE